VKQQTWLEAFEKDQIKRWKLAVVVSSQVRIFLMYRVLDGISIV